MKAVNLKASKEGLRTGQDPGRRPPGGRWQMRSAKPLTRHKAFVLSRKSVCQ